MQDTDLISAIQRSKTPTQYGEGRPRFGWLRRSIHPARPLLMTHRKTFSRLERASSLGCFSSGA